MSRHRRTAGSLALPATCLVLAAVSPASAQGYVAVPLYTTVGAWASFIRVNAGGFSALVVLDTGSPLFWLTSATQTTRGGPATACPSSTGFVPTGTGAVALGRTTSFAYGGGYMSGPVYNVSLAFSGASPPNVATAVVPVTSATSFENMPCGGGILGVDASSVTAPLLFAAAGLPRLFAVELNCPNLSSIQVAGRVTFGGYDTSRHTGALATVPLVPLAQRVGPSPSRANPQGYLVNSTDWWQFRIASVSVGGRVVASSTAAVPLQGIFDTGTFALASGPGNGWTNLLAVSFDCSNYTSLPDVTFEVVLSGGGTLPVTLTPRDYVYQRGASDCLPLTSTLADIPGNLFVLGDPFFYRYYPVFDYEQNAIRVAPRSTPGSCPGVAGPPPTPPPTPAPTPSPLSPPAKTKTSAGEDVGIFLGVVVLLALAGAVGLYIYYDRRPKASYITFEDPLDPDLDPGIGVVASSGHVPTADDDTGYAGAGSGGEASAP